jgi:hypothetical protein
MGDLRSAFDTAVEQNRLVAPVDGGLVEAGRKIADQIDYAQENLTGQDLTKALYLMPHLVNILKEMLATPAARKAAGILEEGSRGKLASLPPVARPKRSA